MTPTGPLARVIAVLEDAGYEIVDQPRRIGGIPFEFSAMLAGRSSLDLIAIIDLAVEADDASIRRRIEGLARALDLVRSRRSLTVILLGPRRSASLIRAIAGVARVLTVGSPGDEDEADLLDALAVLLPLEVATDDEATAELWAAARERIIAADPAETEPVLSAARSGEAAVETALRLMLSKPIEDLQAASEAEDE